MTTRFTRESWLKLGCKQLTEIGPDSLTIEKLCRSASKTKGSFYHHFADLESYINALLEYWRQCHTTSVIDHVETADSGQAQTEALDRQALELDHALEVAFRLFAQSNSVVRQYLNEVDKERIAYMQELYKRTHDWPTNKAKSMAELEYSAFVGAMVLWPDGNRDKFKELNQNFKSLLKSSL